jgi:outer membrane cobalamin receptor
MPARIRSAFFSRFAALLIVLPLVSQGSALAAGIHGTVTGPDHQPLAGARVVVSGRISVAAWVDSGASGEFRIGQLDAGPYELRVLLDGFRTDPVRLSLARDEDRPVAIRMQLSAWSESIVVSTSQVDAPLSRTADSVTVLTSTDLRAHQVEDLTDALRLVPGFAIARSGGRGALTSVFPRGGESDFALVLVDGIRMNAFGGSFDFSKLPAANIERVEAVRGPQSALYGSDAIGGVVQVVTLHDGPPSVDGLVEAGGLGTRRATLATSGSRGGWSWGGAAERLASDGFTGTAQATGERVTNDDYRISQGSLSLGWRTNRGVDARGTGRMLSSERGFPGPFGSNPIGAYTTIDRISRGVNDERQIGVSVSSPWPGAGWRVRQRIQVNRADLQDRFTSPFGQSDTETTRTAARAQTDVVLGDRTSASLGLEYQRERADSTYITGRTAEPIPVTRDIVGYFAEVRQAGGARLFATAGLRVEQIRRQTLEEDPNPFAPRPPFDVSSTVSANPKATVAYLARSPEDGHVRFGWTRLHASAGTGIRPPDALEIAFTDNPGLKPERSRSLDAGITQALAAGTVSVEITAFANHFDDLIVAIGRSLQDASRYRTDNIANARTRGLEVSVAARSSFGLNARLGYTLLDSAVLAVDHLPAQAPAPFEIGDPLLRRPRHQASLDLVLTRPRVTAYAEVGARGRMLDLEPSLGTFGGLFRPAGYLVAHAGVAYRVTDTVELYARVCNVFDRPYEEVFGYPAMRRNGIAGIRVAARK